MTPAVRVLAVMAVAGSALPPAHGDPVSFSAIVSDTCIVKIVSAGTLGMNASGTAFSSEDANGTAAIISVATVGGAPTLDFDTPTLTGPAQSIAGATVLMSYTAERGPHQDLARAPRSYPLRHSRDTIKLRARAINIHGFESGTYAIVSTVTCQQ